jgi:pimeloyl-ACP methyl ester carboxylesterase
MRIRLRTAAAALLAGAISLAGSAAADNNGNGKNNNSGKLQLDAIGSLSAGGRKVCAPGIFDPKIAGAGSRNQGQCFWIDQIYAQYLIPKNSKKLPIVFIHGGAGTGRVWETTPDGREGFATIFARRGHPTYVVDFPRRGRAGIPSFIGSFGDLDGQQIVPPNSFAVGDKQAFYSWRLGASYPDFFPNSKFPKSGLDQFLQSTVPIFSDNNDVITDSIVALLDKIGPAILVTHSQSGIHGWMARFKSNKVKGIITFEGGFVFPQNKMPPAMQTCAGSSIAQGSPVSEADFNTLVQIPILAMYGDNQPTCPEPNLIRDGQQLRPLFGKTFVNELNSRGGKASYLWTREKGIRGNTHFLFLDTNNVQIADFVSSFLRKNGLDKDYKKQTLRY